MRQTFAQASRSTGTTIMTNDDLRRAAPSIFAPAAFHAMKERYKFVPTIEVVDMLRDRGLSPVRAIQSSSRIEGKSDFTKHMIRFRPTDLVRAISPGEELPELVLLNSHDGTSAYKFLAGIFRVVCANGMICQSEEIGSISLRHAGGQDFHQRVIDTTYEVMDSAPATMEAIKTFKQIELTAPQRQAFATAAHALHPSDNFQPTALLRERRREDRETSSRLFTTTNIVQENIMQGGIRGTTPTTQRRSTTRPVKSVGEDLRINRALWTLQTEMARLLGA